ncbi:metallophosphoesterase family protein [Janthinobacterium sp. B9-8]|uniref:metallophosphoesterase family protein n=1 Tax=Janthinobacterium sp. B9-8 TaxID=1236179 RepID=UPI00061CF031|nr:metallophosphoesterase [Janthinobacterium sp. B9-8]AMC35408.1 hypothetical protein VN23_12685 [Janthinobacterium sp. B9-8]
MKFDIVHISDLHFGNPLAHQKSSDIKIALDSLLGVVENKIGSFLVISGDVTFKGSPDGYAEAQEIIRSAIIKNGFNLRNVLVCPGNHDLIKSGGRLGFSLFDAWSAGIRNDTQCRFNNSGACFIKSDDVDFLLMNTSYHLDHKMGKVDLVKVKALLEEHCPEKTSHRFRIAIAHHHFIPVEDEDSSTTRNAYSVLSLLDDYGFSALLHGHQHARLSCRLGARGMKISGVGSMSYLTPGYINSVAIYNCDDQEIKEIKYYGLTLDSSTGLVDIK